MNARGDVIGKNCEGQTRRTFENIRSVLKEFRATPRDVIKTTAYLVRREDFRAYNKVRGEFFRGYYPASTTVIVKSLYKKEMLVEVEAIAHAWNTKKR